MLGCRSRTDTVASAPDGTQGSRPKWRASRPVIQTAVCTSFRASGGDLSSAPPQPEAGWRAAIRSALGGLGTTANAENTLRPIAMPLSQIRECVRAPRSPLRLWTPTSTGDLAQDFVDRIDRLGELELDSRARRAVFGEFINAFTLHPLRLVMLWDFCSCSPINHSVQMAGRMYRWDRLVATWHRELVLDQRVVVHHYLEVEAPYRAAGIGPGLLLSGFELYDRLGMERVVLQAGLASGKWHWARCGFDFIPGTGDDAIRFYNAMVERLGLPIDTSEFRSATEYALAAPEVQVTFSSIASILSGGGGPAVVARIREIAFENDIDFHEPVPAAKAIMLCGPGWDGYLPLRGPRRAAFDAYLASRLAAVRRRLDGLDQGGVS